MDSGRQKNRIEHYIYYTGNIISRKINEMMAQINQHKYSLLYVTLGKLMARFRIPWHRHLKFIREKNFCLDIILYESE